MNVSGSFRLLSASDLGLPADEAAGVAGFLVSPAGDRAALRVRSAELLGAVTALPAAIAIVVFVDDPAAAENSSAAGEFLIRRMVKSFGDLDVHALIRPVAATEAVKRIRSGLVAESIDRATLNPLRAPEIVDRRALEQALADVDGDSFVNPTHLIASSGGVVLVAES